MKVFSQLQLELDKEKGIESFKDYKNALFPYEKKAQEKETVDLMKVIEREANKGPLRVTRLQQPSASSRIHNRTTSSVTSQPTTGEDLDRIYSRMAKKWSNKK